MVDQNRGNGGRWSTLADVPDTGVWPLAHPIPVADTISRIDDVIGALDPSHSDTSVVEELRSAQNARPLDVFQLRCSKCGGQPWLSPNRDEPMPWHEIDGRRCFGVGLPGTVVVNVGRPAPVLPVEGRHPDGWGPCPDGCPCTACDPWEHPDPDLQGTDIVDVDSPPARGWLARLLHRLNR